MKRIKSSTLAFNGTLKWRFETVDDIISLHAIVSDETIYITSVDHYLIYAISNK
ncbi:MULTISPECIES: hypothetical protein [Thermoanaerobacter]|uniref:Uncharacterized protein n=1 Tax=Thermoanaerobacter brockii subsp. finnii (strain ATCC 43586 / DSM 3389 / AKO-1) TaxID=509193 RepID=E8UTZ6_THEBF|nr:MULTISPECIES: hypothetical protein [Thermoanaerobacter]ADV79983.1 hypothetical protein Thebr_1414 [Thermoanaerobacter brockii subsp. finnii Ako-1]